MKKIKRILQMDLENIKISYNKEKLFIFTLTFLTSIIVHFQLYALMITGPDTLINSMYHQADIWETMLLRFGLYFVQLIKGNIVSPVLVTLISSAILSGTVIVVIDLFKIKNKYFKYIIALVFAVAPNISATLTFFYCSDAYILGLFLATLAVYLVNKHEKSKVVIVISGLLLAISMGMYQTYLSVSMVLCVATLIIDLLHNSDIKHILKKIVRYILMGIIGLVLFYVLSHLTLKIRNLPISNYSGANKIGLETLKEFPHLVPQSYKSFFSYFFNDNIIPNTIWKTNIFYTIIFVVALISTVTIFINEKIYKNISNTIILILLIAILPMCFGIIEIIAPDVDIHILMACSMIYIFPIFFKILEMIPKHIIGNIIKYIVMFCSLSIVWIYVWQDNASYIAIRSMQNQAISTTTRLVTRIEELDGYTPQTPVLLLGGLENNRYLNRYDTTMMDTRKLYERS